jgi:hypothetical protein
LKKNLYATPDLAGEFTIAKFVGFSLPQHQNPDKWSRQMIRSADSLRTSPTTGGAL